MAVIEYTKCLESYKSTEGFASVFRLAESMGCPSWMVTIRHRLVHSESKDINFGDLARAVAFIFRWLDLHFFAVLLEDEFPRPPGELVAQQQELFREMSYYPSEQLPKTQISGQDNYRVLTWNEETLKAEMHKLIRETKDGEIKESSVNKLAIYSSKYPNEYMSTLADVVMLQLKNQFAQLFISENTFNADGRFLAGVGRVLGIALGQPNQPKERLLLTLLNLLTNKIDQIGEKSCEQEIESLKSGLSFMAAILQTIVEKENENKKGNKRLPPRSKFYYITFLVNSK